MSLRSAERLAVSADAKALLLHESGATKVEHYAEMLSESISYVFSWEPAFPGDKGFTWRTSIGIHKITVMRDEDEFACYLRDQARRARYAHDKHSESKPMPRLSLDDLAMPFDEDERMYDVHGNYMGSKAGTPVTSSEKFDKVVDLFRRLNVALQGHFATTKLHSQIAARVRGSAGTLWDIEEDDEFTFKGVVFMRDEPKLGVMLERHDGHTIFFSPSETDDMFGEISDTAQKAIGSSLSDFEREAVSLLKGRRELSRALSDATYKTLDHAREKVALKKRDERADFYGNNTHTGLF